MSDIDPSIQIALQQQHFSWLNQAETKLFLVELEKLYLQYVTRTLAALASTPPKHDVATKYANKALTIKQVTDYARNNADTQAE